jgi:cell division protein FtsQ
VPKPPAPPKPKFSWRTALRIAVWLSVFAGLAWGASEAHSFLLRDPRFELRCDPAERTCASLEIRGAVYASRYRIAQVFAPDFGQSVFHIPLAERRRHLLAIDWVRAASVTRIWPDQIVVTVTERRPVAFAKLPIAGTGRYWLGLVDDDGVLLSVPPHVRFHLPMLSGISEQQTDEERRARVKTMERLLDDLGSNARGISEINVGALDNVRVISDLDGRALELWIGDREYRSRYMNFVNHYGEIRSHSEQARVFDLRMDDRILARQDVRR